VWPTLSRERLATAPDCLVVRRGELKLPRFRCAVCGCGKTGVNWPSHLATDVLQHLPPIDVGTSPETLRSHTLLVGKQIVDAAADKSPATISLDSTFIRGRDDGECHLEVRVGNVETVDGGRQVFSSVAGVETDITALIQRTLETVSRSDTTEVTAFTDGCQGLRAVLANAGMTPTDFGLVSYRALAPNKSWRRPICRLTVLTERGEGDDRRRGRTSALAHLEGHAKNAQDFVKQKGNSANISVTGPQAPSSINSTRRNETRGEHQCRSGTVQTLEIMPLGHRPGLHW
jgi:hypothetical protein